MSKKVKLNKEAFIRGFIDGFGGGPIWRYICSLRGHAGLTFVGPSRYTWRCKKCGALVNTNPWRP